MFIKICGITRPEDARHAVDHGATALGFVFWARSPRFVTLDRAAAIVAAVPRGTTTVGVFVGASLEDIRQAVTETGITMVQLHGDEPAEYGASIDVPVVRAVTLESVAGARLMWPLETVFLLDATDPVRRGGTGTVVDWQKAALVARDRQVILAGGLTPQNVAAAVATVRPFGVDVSSGVEQTPGIKDMEKMTRFLASARAAFADNARATLDRR